MTRCHLSMSVMSGKTKLANDEIELTIVMNNKPTADDFMKVAAVAVTSIH